MRRRTLTNLVLFSIVAALAAVLAFTGPKTKKPAANPLTQIAPTSISHISLVRANSPDVEFERGNGNWNLVAPVKVRASRSRVNAMLQLLHARSYANLPAQSGKLARFGLDKPKITLSLGDHKFSFGDTDPIDDRRYILYGGAVHLVDDYLYFQLTQDPGFFTDPTLLPPGSEPIRITYPDSTLALDSGVWTQQPAAGKKGNDLKTVVLDWETARAITVRTLRPAESHGQITVDLKKGPSVTFELVGDNTNPVLARTDLDLEYHLDSYTAKQLLLKKPEPKSGTGKTENAPPAESATATPNN